MVRPLSSYRIMNSAGAHVRVTRERAVCDRSWGHVAHRLYNGTARNELPPTHLDDPLHSGVAPEGCCEEVPRLVRQAHVRVCSEARSLLLRARLLLPEGSE